MDGCPILDDQQLAAQPVEQMVQEPYNIATFEGLGLHRDQQGTSGSDPADHREMIPRQRHPQHGRLAAWGVTTHSAREQVEPGLVYPDDDSAIS